jgi:hypothetical protein
MVYKRTKKVISKRKDTNYRKSTNSVVAEGTSEDELYIALGSVTFTYEYKIAKQMLKRGWSDTRIQEALNNPARTVRTTDTRFLPNGTGARMNDLATAHYHKDGGYVVRNNNTGDIVQVSDVNDPNWKDPWYDNDSNDKNGGSGGSGSSGDQLEKRKTGYDEIGAYIVDRNGNKSYIMQYDSSGKITPVIPVFNLVNPTTNIPTVPIRIPVPIFP